MIIVTDGPRVKLNFTDFALQETGCRSPTEGKCTCDYVKVYDGETNSTLAELCGSKLPGPVISNSKKMLVIFSSNNLDGFKGFHAEYMSTSDEASTSIVPTTKAGLLKIFYSKSFITHTFFFPKHCLTSSSIN